MSGQVRVIPGPAARHLWPYDFLCIHRREALLTERTALQTAFLEEFGADAHVALQVEVLGSGDALHAHADAAIPVAEGYALTDILQFRWRTSEVRAGRHQ
jgi:hypothetical protein